MYVREPGDVGQTFMTKYLKKELYFPDDQEHATDDLYEEINSP
jgi:hypothetical protein